MWIVRKRICSRYNLFLVTTYVLQNVLQAKALQGTVYHDPDSTQMNSYEGRYVVQWDGDNDPMDPHSKSWASHWRKWTIVIIVASSAFCVTCASAIYTVATEQIQREFRCSQELVTLGLTVFVIGLGCGPMLLSPLSELYGRRHVYLVSYALFTIWLIPCALARNIETMLVSRFLSGLTGSAFLSVAGGTIADMFNKEELGAPMMLFTLAPFSGPATGPVWGGVVVSFVNWRWIFYVMIIWSAIQWFALIFLVPETYTPVLLRRKAIAVRQATGDVGYSSIYDGPPVSVAKAILRNCSRPFNLLYHEMICLSLCILSALLLGVLYLFFGAFPIIFGTNYRFNTWNSGLAFLGIFIGMCIGASCDGLWKRLCKSSTSDQSIVSDACRYEVE